MDMRGKTVLITGSTDGVGRHVATRLAAEGAKILIHGRSAERAKTLIDEIVKAGDIAPTFYQADLSSMAGTRELAAAVIRDHQRLDVFVSNAGIGSQSDGPQRQESRDGHELRFAVNYLAGFLLTSELLPLLKAGASARIVNVASAGQQAIDFDDVMLTHGYSGVRAYCQSKLAQILFTVDLAEQLKGTGITVNALHPASYMDTTMVRQAGVTPWSSVETGADAILDLAASPSLEGRSGRYFDGQRESRADAQAYDEKARRRLRALSLELTEQSSATSREKHS